MTVHLEGVTFGLVSMIAVAVNASLWLTVDLERIAFGPVSIIAVPFDDAVRFAFHGATLVLRSHPAPG